MCDVTQSLMTTVENLLKSRGERILKFGRQSCGQT